MDSKLGHHFPCLQLRAEQEVAVLSVFTHRDYTDNDLDGGEVENASRSRSSPPIPSVTRCLDAHFGQDQLAIESTGKSLSFCLPVSLHLSPGVVIPLSLLSRTLPLRSLCPASNASPGWVLV